MDRPIILSPPPLDPMMPVGHTERQPSLGFNLQHEFETLTADLDLDLKERSSEQQASKTVSLSGDLLVPQASRYGFDLLLDSNGTQSQHSFMKSKPAFSSSNPVPERPQSVNDFSSFFGHQPVSMDQGPNFYLELIRYTNWINGLNSRESATMADYMSNNVSFDVLLALRTKIDAKLQVPPSAMQSSILLGQSLPPVHSVPPGMFGGPSSYQNDLVHDMDHLSLASSSLGHGDDSMLHQPKPKSNGVHGQLFDGARAKSAEPSINGKLPVMSGNQMSHPLDRSKSPTSHLYEKTNFLQLAAGNQATPQNRGTVSEESLDMSQAALKLGALATINSRAALDSKKGFLPSNYHRHGFEDPCRPAKTTAKSPPSGKPKRSTPLSDPVRGYNSDMSHLNLPMPLDVTNPELLENIPAWLKILRLHKYTDCLKDIHWRDLIEFDDAQLEAHGVKALGARTKLLKTFDAVKKRA